MAVFGCHAIILTSDSFNFCVVQKDFYSDFWRLLGVNRELLHDVETEFFNLILCCVARKMFSHIKHFHDMNSHNLNKTRKFSIH